MGAEHDAVPDLDRLFADLAHPNPYIQTEAFTAMAEHWQAEAMPRLIALLDQPDVSLRRSKLIPTGRPTNSTLATVALSGASVRRPK